MAWQAISKMSEQWKPVAGYIGWYEVSDHGRVRSVDRLVRFADGRLRWYRGRLLKTKPHNQYGYPLVAICRGKDKRWRTVHQLVMEAFVGPCPPGKEICHNVLTRSARLVDLRYDTKKNNFADKHKHGTALCGPKHPWTKYPRRLLVKIQRATGTITEIAKRFNVSRTHVWNVRNGKRRAHG
jgi:hypothetical protein